MKELKKEITGERGELLEIFTDVVCCEGEMAHATVKILLDSFRQNDDGTVSIYFAPNDAELLAEKLIAFAKKANNSNYHLLRHKTPF